MINKLDKIQSSRADSFMSILINQRCKYSATNTQKKLLRTSAEEKMNPKGTKKSKTNSHIYESLTFIHNS